MSPRHVIAVRIPEPRPWTRYAACKGMNTELFFPTPSGGMGVTADQDPAVQAAVTVCRACPVVLPCLVDATRDKEAGIWGGTTAGERHLLRRQQAREVAA